MSGLELGVWLFLLMIALVMLRMPVGLAMLVVGGLGYVLLSGWGPLVSFLKTSTYGRVSSYPLSVIPLFLLMGQLATKAGMSKALFESARAWVGHRPGGLAIAAIGGCAAFGAICGSSLATAATMAQVSLPEMRRHGYSGALATATLAAGGTLGILIPPSLILVIYGVITEQSIGDLFLAAIIPGVLATLGYAAAVAAYVRIAPEAGPAGERVSWGNRLRSVRAVWPVAGIFLLVIGGIYQGWFSPTEGAAVGAASVGVLAAVSGHIGWGDLREVLLETAQTTAMIFLILIGAEIYNSFLALSQLPVTLAGVVETLGLAPLAVVAVMLLIYLVLGCVMDSLSMILLTVPVFFPIVQGLELGMTPSGAAIWFGILALISVEVGLITPPIGINIFVINAMARDVPMAETFKGVTAFLVSDVVRVAIILLFPATCLWLPGLN